MTALQRFLRTMIRAKDDKGFALLEVLASMLIIFMISMAIATNTVGAFKVAKFTQLNHAASSLAISKIEELAAIDTVNLDESYSGTENSVSFDNMNIDFTRITAVTVNTDGSRAVTVSVTSNNTGMPTTVNFSTTFALWE